jgi:bleomycin hydrolase
LTGIGEDQNGKKYYLTKNSWDSESNEYGGFLYMSEPYVRLNTIAIMVHKEAIPDEIAQKLGIE